MFNTSLTEDGVIIRVGSNEVELGGHLETKHVPKKKRN